MADKRAKGVRMKLFHQRLEKLFNQQLLKQWNETIRVSNSDIHQSPERRRQLELATIPEPIRNLLAQINSRGPSTVGIFRKSPSAKHCKELRHKLETDSQSTIEDFQVTVIASVFKEWLRSLPDCLLMSHLYPQWIDVAKLIEPLQQQQQKQKQKQQQPAHLPSSSITSTNQQDASVTHSQIGRHLRQQRLDVEAGNAQPETDLTATPAQVVPVDDVRDNGADLRFDKGEFPTSTNPSLRPSRSSLADTCCHQPLDRARSCSTILTDRRSPRQHRTTTTTVADVEQHQQVAISNNSSNGFAQCNQQQSGRSALANQKGTNSERRTWRSLASFKLSERRSECLRFVRQLLDNLNDSNLVLLRSFMSVLCRISSNSEVNKMSASNLGVCVGQSLLNDEQQQSSSSSRSPTSKALASYNFSRRLRRTRSYSILSSTFSQSSPNLKIDTAQETAKYVPILVTFMIENARQIFGSDIVDLFPSPHQPAVSGVSEESRSPDSAFSVDHHHHCITSNGVGESLIDTGATPSSCSTVMMTSRESSSSSVERDSPFGYHNLDQVDSLEITSHSSSSPRTSLDGSQTTTTTQAAAMRQLLVVNNRPVVLTTTMAAPATSPNPSENIRQYATSSSGNSSSTSGVHSESPAFSASELDEQSHTSSSSSNNSRVGSSSPRSSVSSPSSMSASSSPIQDHHHLSDCGPETSPTSNKANTTSSSSSSNKQEDLSPHRKHPPVPTHNNSSGPLYPDYHTLASSTPKARTGRSHHRNSLPPNGFSPFMGGSFLARAPKLPVRLSTSSYGGEAIIYNPKPANNLLADDHQRYNEYCIVCPHGPQQFASSPSSSSMSVKPLSPRRQQSDHDNQSRVITVSEQPPPDDKEERLNQFLAHQHQHQQQQPPPRPLPSAPSVPLRSSAQQQQSQRAAILQHHNSIQLPIDPIDYYARQQQQLRSELNYPIFHSSSANLNGGGGGGGSLQQALHHQYYSSPMMCCSSLHRRDCLAALEAPARSHVMSLRDYYLSLQQRRQQQQNSYTLHRHSQLMRQQQLQPQAGATATAATNEPQINNQQQQPLLVPSSQYYGHKKQQQQQQQQHYKMAADNSHFQMASESHRQQQTIVAANGNFVNLAAASAALAIHRPQTKLARIRQNQFNTGNSTVGRSAAAAPPPLYVSSPKEQQKLHVTGSAQATTKMMSIGEKTAKLSTSSADHSSGNCSSAESSDECSSSSNDWTESTMV